MRFVPLTLILTALPALTSAQETALTVALGKDTVALERYTRSATRMTGEVVSRFGAAGNRIQYDITIANGRPVSMVYRPRPLTAAPAPTAAREIKITFVGDSVRREAVFADSTNTRMLPAAHGVPYLYPAFGLLEIAFAELRKTRAAAMTVATVGLGTNNPGTITITPGRADTVTVVSAGGFVLVFRVDPEGKVLEVDGSRTTQKVLAKRGANNAELDALAARMTPIGQLSGRGLANGSFIQSVVFLSYGRPLVRGRTVWGGLLVPPDTIWRLGANEATHIATSRELTFGTVVVPPGLYTLWLFNGKTAPQLVINRQVGQWGTSYDPAQDLGRVPVTFSATPEHVEEFTITVRNTGQGRGALEFAWGSQMATAAFTVRP